MSTALRKPFLYHHHSRALVDNPVKDESTIRRIDALLENHFEQRIYYKEQSFRMRKQRQLPKFGPKIATVSCKRTAWVHSSSHSWVLSPYNEKNQYIIVIAKITYLSYHVWNANLTSAVPAWKTTVTHLTDVFLESWMILSDISNHVLSDNVVPFTRKFFATLPLCAILGL